MRAVPLRVEADGTLVLAGADPLTDITAAGRQARLVLAPAEQVDALLPAAPQPASATPGLIEPSEWEAVMSWPDPVRRRRVRPWALLGLVLLAPAVAAAVLADRRDADVPAAAVQAGLPAGVRAELPGRTVPREQALAAACAGQPAVVVLPLDDAPCALSRGAAATVGATILVAPGGGCITAARARRLTAVLRAGRPTADARPLAVRPDDGGACVTPDATTLRAGVYPLSRQAVVVVRPQEARAPAARRLGAALRDAQARAPVTTLVAPRAVS